MSKITFLGASGTVTGSKYLVEISEPNLSARILVDAGLFQGEKIWRDKNWDNLDSLELDKIDACLLTHAHIDHTGFLPRLVKMGLKCPVYATPATCSLTKLLLLDSARLQEEEAWHRQKKGSSSHHPPLPLYETEDAKQAIDLLRAVSPEKVQAILPGVSASFAPMGHILGASSINLSFGAKRISFSGDIGRYAVPILKDPAPIELGDLLLIESTYARTEHHRTDSQGQFAQIINESVEDQGVLVIPSFAIGRTQNLLFYLRELKQDNKIPNIPVYVDSPMASDATEIYAQFSNEYDPHSLGLFQSKIKPFSFERLNFCNSREESMALNKKKGPMIIISASGMATGGRILHHLQHRLSYRNNTVLFVGYQPRGSRGDLLLSGADWISIFNDRVDVRAQIKSISGLSAHADQSELLRWLNSCTGKPAQVAVVHGEPESTQFFAEKLNADFGLNAKSPKYKETWDI
jgi:metallo-beta-lactamase family protein